MYIDGIPQLKDPHSSTKPPALQKAPDTPDLEQDAKDAVKYDGLPHLTTGTTTHGTVIFANVSSLFIKTGGTIVNAFSQSSGGVVIVENGKIVCSGSCPETSSSSYASAKWIDVDGGTIS